MDQSIQWKDKSNKKRIKLLCYVTYGNTTEQDC